MQARDARIFVLAFVVLAPFAGIISAADVPASQPQPLRVHLWWSRASMATGALDRATEFGATGLILENDLGNVGWGESTSGLCNYDFSKRFRREGADRAEVEKLREQYRQIIGKARKLGMDSYVMCPEVAVPAGFGAINLDDPALWSLIGDRLREVFRALPELSGYMLYLTEGIQDIEFLPGSETSKSARARKLLETCWEACRAERRKMLVTTFIHSREMLDAVAEALRAFPPDPNFMVVHYCCPNDWGLYALTNPAIGRVGPHPEVLGFDVCGENWGQGSHPFIQSEFMARRLREARERGGHIVGLASYVSWSGHSVMGTLNEANLATAQALLRSPQRDGRDILGEWCVRRFNEKGAQVAATCLSRTQKAVFEAQHVFGYWVDTVTKSGLPSLEEMDRYFIDDFFGEALAKWDPAHARTWDRIRSPDEAFMADLLAEKNDAIRLSQQSLNEIRAARDLLRPDDFQGLQRAFSFQAHWARVWRDRMHAFFLRQMARKKGWPADLRQRLEQVLTEELANADELEHRYGAAMFPYSPQRERQFVHDIRKEMPAAVGALPSSAAKKITMASLLAEMTDLVDMAEFPDPPYTCKQFSSYDRASTIPADHKTWFANDDRGQYLRVEERAGRREYVMMDAVGPGSIVRIWSANPEGTLRIYLDGSDTPALETPMKDLLGGTVVNIPNPIACEKSRGWTSYFPIPYAKNCKVTGDMGGVYYHVNYRTYPAETQLVTFDKGQLDTVAGLIKRTAARLAAPRMEVGPPPVYNRTPFEAVVDPGKSHTLIQLNGSRAIHRFEVQVTAQDPVEALRNLVLTMTFDGETTVESPVGDFFGAGPGINAYESLPLGVAQDGMMWCQWCMPFAKSASIELRNFGTASVTIKGGVSTLPYTWTSRSMHFHAKWRSQFEVPTRPMHDWSYLKAKGKGVFAGVAFATGNPVMNWWGEGDEKIYVDGETFPSHFGTGTEDYYGYAWCCAWPFSHAYHNQPRCDGPDNWGEVAVNRWHILDRIPFTKDFNFDMELWHWADDLKLTMSVIPYWYAMPGATDEIRPIQEADLKLRPVKPWPSQKTAGVIEGETMRIIEKTAEARPLRLDQCSDGKVMWWGNGTQPGDKLVLGFGVEKAGQYHILAHLVRGADYGIVQLSINGVHAGRPFDLHHDFKTAERETDLGAFDLSQGENRIVVEMVGANEKAAKEYPFGLDYVRLKPAR